MSLVLFLLNALFLVLLLLLLFVSKGIVIVPLDTKVIFTDPKKKKKNDCRFYSCNYNIRRYIRSFFKYLCKSLLAC
jgi:hypothetical protein